MITGISKFDGVTCEESSSQNFQISQITSIAESHFNIIQNSLDEFTVEFWFKPTRAFTNSKELLMISTFYDEDPVISITKE
jgi:hypothetical protein